MLVHGSGNGPQSGSFAKVVLAGSGNIRDFTVQKNSLSAAILQLRKQLQDAFPAAHAFEAAPSSENALSDLECLKGVGGVPKGCITEVVARSSSALFLGMLLRALQEEGQRVALIDGRNALDLQTLGAEHCQGLLWVRCCEAEEAVKAADLLLRDGNLPFVILDLQLNAKRELVEIPSHTWYRLRNLAEETDTVLLTLNEARMVPCAALRLELRNELSLEALEQPRQDLEARLRVAVLRSLRQKLGGEEETRMAG